MMIIVSGYTLARNISMEILIGVSGCLHLCAKTPGVLLQMRSIMTLEFWLSFEMLSLSWSFPPILCFLGCYMMSLGINTVLLWIRTIFSPVRGVWISTNRSPLNHRSRYYLSRTFEIPYPPGVFSRCCVWSCATFCIIWSSPSKESVFIQTPLWGASSIYITAFQIIRTLQ